MGPFPGISPPCRSGPKTHDGIDTGLRVGPRLHRHARRRGGGLVGHAAVCEPTVQLEGPVRADRACLLRRRERGVQRPTGCRADFALAAQPAATGRAGGRRDRQEHVGEP